MFKGFFKTDLFHDDILMDQAPKYDIIVGAELIYYEPMFMPLVSMLQRHSHARTRIFLSSADRGDNSLRFLSLALIHGFSWKEVLRATNFTYASDIGVFELTRKRPTSPAVVGAGRGTDELR